MGFGRFEMLKNRLGGTADCTFRGSAFGRRLLDLSAAFHNESLSDQALEGLVEELIARCQQQIAMFEDYARNPECRSHCEMVVEILHGYIDLADQFDHMEHCSLACSVAVLESAFHDLQIGQSPFVTAA